MKGIAQFTDVKVVGIWVIIISSYEELDKIIKRNKKNNQVYA